MLDTVTSAVPVTFVQEGEEEYDDPINGVDAFTKGVRKCLEGSVGMPVGIQISTLPFQEEEAIGVLKRVSRLLDYDPRKIEEKIASLGN